MTEKERNDYFHVCALIEYIARETKNHRGDIVNAIGNPGIEKLLYDAEVNHCLSFEQVSDEVIQYYKITQGEFDTISNCQYSVPSFLDIGKLYSIMIEDCAKPGDELEELKKFFLPSSVMRYRTSIQTYITRTLIIWNAPIRKVNCWNEMLNRYGNFSVMKSFPCSSRHVSDFCRRRGNQQTAKICTGD